MLVPGGVYMPKPLIFSIIDVMIEVDLGVLCYCMILLIVYSKHMYDVFEAHGLGSDIIYKRSALIKKIFTCSRILLLIISFLLSVNIS